jgi:hypothetical protein
MALHLSPSGDSLGTRIFLTDQGLTPNGGIVLSDGGYLISGATSAIDSMGRSLGSAELVRFSPADSLLWQQRYSFGNYTNGYELISLRQGGYVLSGWYLDTVSYDLKMFLNRLDESGNAPKPLLFSQLEGAFFHQIIETADNKLFVIGHVTRSDKEYPYMARVSHDCELEWDTVIIDTTDIRRISCMTSFADSTLLLACIAVPERSPTALFDWERLKLVNIAGSGKVLRERVISEECGHPESISIGKDGSIVITTALGYTFDQQRYYVVNVTW